MAPRPASHAGSWYSSNPDKLSNELDSWLRAVPSQLPSGSQVPYPGARVIVAPHAGYSYSGPAAAWAYKSLDLSNAKHVFLLGPSHHKHLTTAALSKHTSYRTPMGDLRLDTDIIKELASTGEFESMSSGTDADEHSLEMHLPYIYKMCSLHFSSPSDFPTLVPIMVGSTSRKTEMTLARILLPYLQSPDSVFVISSDFCHWGTRFSYTYFLPSPHPPAPISSGVNLTLSSSTMRRSISDSIHELDWACIDTMTGKAGLKEVHKRWWEVLSETGNTVCGRHPIGVLLSMLDAAVKLKSESKAGEEAATEVYWEALRYERSSDVVGLRDSSVSYVSALCVPFRGASGA